MNPDEAIQAAALAVAALANVAGILALLIFINGGGRE